QTTNFTGPANANVGIAANLTATASSGLAVTFTSATPAICSVTGNTATGIAVGTCTINANQAGNANYTAAAQVSQSFTVAQGSQSITFPALASAAYGSQISLGATASSGLAVAYTSATSAICTVSGSVATMVGIGTCTINANQAGNANYTAAAQVSQSLSTTQAAQTITIVSMPANFAFRNSPVALLASSTSGLAVSFSSATPSVCTVSGAAATLIGLGTCTFNANQA